MYFLRLYPDELLYSGIARRRVHLGIGNHKTLLHMFFGDSKVAADHRSAHTPSCLGEQHRFGCGRHDPESHAVPSLCHFHSAEAPYRSFSGHAWFLLADDWSV